MIESLLWLGGAFWGLLVWAWHSGPAVALLVYGVLACVVALPFCRSERAPDAGGVLRPSVLPARVVYACVEAIPRPALAPRPAAIEAPFVVPGEVVPARKELRG